VVEAVGQAAGLTGTETADEALEKIVGAIADDEHAARIGRQLAQLLGLEIGEAAPEETLWAIRRFLEGLGRQQPVAFVIDDVQWAEPTMLDLIEYLADWAVDTPLLIACMARLELLDARPSWGGGKLNATSINLEPLTADETGSLVANLLDTIDTIDPAVRKHVVAASEGHPLFAEEMLAMLVDDGRVERRGTSWVAVGDLGDVVVPPTTSALLAARIDRLTHDERSTLERASIMGQLFYRDALDRLSDGDASVELASLIHKQFVRPEHSDVPGIDALAFRHLMIRDTAYEGTPKSQRADLHERFASWLEGAAPEQEELIGYHLEQTHHYVEEPGGDPDRARSLADDAARHLRSAGRRALDRNDIPGAVGLLSRATASMSRDDPEIVPALIDLGIVLTEAGELDESSATLDRAVAIGEERFGGPIAARARVVRWHQSFWTRWGVLDADDVERRIPSELALFERTSDVLGQAWAWTTLGALSWSRCRAADTRIAWRRGVDLFRQAGECHMADDYLTWLVSVVTWGPDPCAEALEEIDRLRAEAEGSIFVEAEIGSDSATLLWMTGEFEEGRRVSRAGHLARAELGRRVADAHSAQLLGWLELMAGNADEAEAILGAAARELRELGSSSFQLLESMHAHALYALGRYDDAAFVATDGWDDTVRDVATNVLSLGARAMVAARRGAFERAEDLARRGLALIDEGDFLNDQADARIWLAEVLELAGRISEAADATRDALDRYRRKGNVTQSATAEARLARLGASP
jgi:hypothetical protein